MNTKLQQTNKVIKDLGSFTFPSLEELKSDKTGTYIEKTNQQDGYIHTEITYTSKDGKVRYNKLEIKPI
jgi:hypothetical protein